MEEDRIAFKILTVKIPLGRSRRRWENFIRIDLKEMGINMRNWIDSTKDTDFWIAILNAALNLWVS